jgi:hypothetical protein
MTASQRYFEALMAYGDEFFAKNEFCQADAQYTAASSIGNLTEPSASHAAKARLECYPATPTTGVVITSTIDPGVPTATTEVVVPTDTVPAPPPSDTPEAPPP